MKNGKRFKLYDKDGKEINWNDLNHLIVVPPMSEESKREFFKGKKRFTLNFADLEPIPDEIKIPCPFGQTKN